jgi:carboxylate-amine ligase
VEIRVCDTPLTVERACQLAAFAQSLAVLIAREPDLNDTAWLAYRSNHFQACRFGLHGSYVTPEGERMRLSDHLRGLLQRLMPIAEELGCADMLGALRDEVQHAGNDARVLRAEFHRLRELPLVVERMAQLWRGESEPREEFEGVATLPYARRRIRAASEPVSEVQDYGRRAWGGSLH